MQYSEIQSKWWTYSQSISSFAHAPDHGNHHWYLVGGLPGFSEDLESIYKLARAGSHKSASSLLDHWEKKHRKMARSIQKDLDAESLIHCHFRHLNRYAQQADHLTLSTWQAQAEILASRLFYGMLSQKGETVSWISLPSLVRGEIDFLEEDIVHFRVGNVPAYEGQIFVTQRSLCRMPNGSIGYFPEQIIPALRSHVYTYSTYENQSAA